MGIQDRDYYRNEGPSVLDALVPSGIICRWLITLNVAIYFLQLVAFANGAQHDAFGRPTSYGWVTEWFLLDTDKVLQGQVWRLFTFAFLHAPDSWLHVIFNMLFLWWFGSDVEQLYGRKEFFAIYMVSALTGGIAFEVWGLVETYSFENIVPHRCLGASGAVTTMLVLCALHYPRRIVFFWLLPMPIWLFALLNIGKDTMVFISGVQTGTAVVVHLAGAVFAVAYYKWQRSITDFVGDMMWWRRTGNRSRLKLFRPESDKEDEEPVGVSAAITTKPKLHVVDEHLEAKLDAVLEKIAKTGKESLTEEEQQILKEASAMYKRRRT